MDWTIHRDPAGFTVSLPTGWTAAAADKLVLIRNPEHTALCLIHPFWLSRPESAAVWLQRCAALLQPLLPQLQIQQVETYRAQPDEARARGIYLQNGAPGQASLLCSLDGQSGMLFGIAAGQTQFALLKPVLLYILQSFSFTSPAASDQTNAPAGPVFVRWTDPQEYAFSLEAPQGWPVSGGLFRAGPVDVRPALEIVSPDHRVRITAGDPTITPFVEPDMMMAMMGFTEGANYSPGYGQQMTIMRYIPGLAFARMHVENKIAPRGSSLTFTSGQDRPDLAQIYNAQGAQMAAFAQIITTIGETEFRFQYGGETWNGYYLAGTQRTQAIGVGTAMWHVVLLYGFVCPPDRISEAQTVLARMVQTFQFNPQWQTAQGQTAVNTSRIVSETNNEISRIIHQSYAHRQEAMDDIHRRNSNVILGLTDVIDPATGETWKVESGHNYYWRNTGTNTVAGTSTYDRPDINFEPLKEW